ncbi:iron-containing redox enzyme family protein [Acidovorax sp. NCPPB 3576]|uniref:iron-containing redox enzyme family protein n=1 Tax=Acidovorax sp. NCPPB 3576 TaxID=2940488 RepID=UPI00234B1EBA|nr:iron-containing redox enzyme family protein [Acidovorax sp. NCPPB 3576]WCM86347.1 iron-containing redox enzyme family protein [Acidovorax sp. NCPPB 3576]
MLAQKIQPAVACQVIPATHALNAQRLNAAAPYRRIYEALLKPAPTPQARQQAAQWLQRLMDESKDIPSELCETPEDLHAWSSENAQAVAQRYQTYLDERRAGGERQYFRSRAHALNFLASVAPTKMVDGSWLYGLALHTSNERLRPLLQTYLEELGDGVAHKNHVTLYRQLMRRHSIHQDLQLDDAHYLQGAVQLALGWNVERFLPEVIGFNLAYEQLPLHLLITAYELNELGIDPYYFTLHVTVDNGDSGHAWQACEAVLQMLQVQEDRGHFWQRVRAGSKLANAGRGTREVIESFDARAEVVRIFERKASAGAGMHSDYCRVGGRTINDWLGPQRDIGALLDALVDGGWIKLGAPVAQSRFWNLLQGERAEMFGVFTGYELQVIHDWIRGDDSRDGQDYAQPSSANQTRRLPSFRALARHRSGDQAPGHSEPTLDPELDRFKAQLQSLEGDPRRQFLSAALSPATHWTSTGLLATRLFISEGWAD